MVYELRHSLGHRVYRAVGPVSKMRMRGSRPSFVPVSVREVFESSTGPSVVRHTFARTSSSAVGQSRRRSMDRGDTSRRESEGELTPKSRKSSASAASSNLNLGRTGIAAMLLSKPSSRQQATKRAQTEGHPARSGSRRNSAGEPKPRGVLLCGDILPIWGTLLP